MNDKTRRLHGLKAAQNLVELVAHLARSGAVQIGSCEIDLDDGKKHKLNLTGYVDLALDGLTKSIDAMKAGDSGKSGAKSGPLLALRPGLN